MSLERQRRSLRYPDPRQKLPRRLRELLEQPGGEPHGLCKPICEPDGTSLSLDRWIRGDLTLHLNIRIGSRLPDIDACEFCADLQRGSFGAIREPSESAVPKVRDFVSGAIG